MRYKFIAPVHYMGINSVLNKGIQLKNNIYISNNSNYVDEMFRQTDIYSWVGQIGYQELLNATYIYANGNIDELQIHESEDSRFLPSCFYFLREAQFFLDLLWEFEDHSSYVRDGFLYIYGGKSDPILIKASVSQVSSNQNGEIKNKLFSKEQILSARKEFIDSPKIDINGLREGGKYSVLNPFGDELSRVDRAGAFVYKARGESSLPFKLINYCIALECLFTSDNSEVNHKVAERTSLLVGTNKEDRIKIYDLVKKAYGIRSKLSHGQPIKENVDRLLTVTKQMDELLRIILRVLSVHEVFQMNNQDLDLFFKELILTREY